MLAPRFDRAATASAVGIGECADFPCVYVELKVVKSHTLAEPQAEQAGESASCVKMERRADGAEG